LKNGRTVIEFSENNTQREAQKLAKKPKTGEICRGGKA